MRPRRARWQRRLPLWRRKLALRSAAGGAGNVLLALVLLLAAALVVSVDLPATQRAEEYLTFVLTRDMALPSGNWTTAWDRVAGWAASRWQRLQELAGRVDRQLDEVWETLAPARETVPAP